MHGIAAAVAAPAAAAGRPRLLHRRCVLHSGATSRPGGAAGVAKSALGSAGWPVSEGGGTDGGWWPDASPQVAGSQTSASAATRATAASH